MITNYRGFVIHTTMNGQFAIRYEHGGLWCMSHTMTDAKHFINLYYG